MLLKREHTLHAPAQSQEQLTIKGFDESAYSIFINAIPYNFYPILTIAFLFMVATTGAFSTTQSGQNGFITRLDPGRDPADQLLYSTYVGGERI